MNICYASIYPVCFSTVWVCAINMEIKCAMVNDGADMVGVCVQKYNRLMQILG